MQLVALMGQMGNYDENQFISLSGLVEKKWYRSRRSLQVYIYIYKYKYINRLFYASVSIFAWRIRVLLVSNSDCCCLSV